MGYSREEQETTLVFDSSTGMWNIYSTVPKHIRKLTKLTELKVLELENGRSIAVKGELTEKQVLMRQDRIVSNEVREKASERLSKARNSRKTVEKANEIISKTGNEAITIVN